MKRKRGMTLVEVIISFVIIVIVGTMIVSVFGSYLNKFKIVRDDITTKGFKNQGTVEEQTEQIIDKVSFRNEAGSILLGLDAEEKISTNPSEKAKIKKKIKKLQKEQTEAIQFLKKYKDQENDWERAKTVSGSNFVLTSNTGEKIWQKKGIGKEDVYQVYALDGSSKLLMTAWIFGNNTVDKVPIIREIVRYVDTDTPVNRAKQIEEYGANKKLFVKIKYLRGFENKKDTPELVTWYQSIPGHHIYPWTWDVGELIGNEYTPIFPDSYDFIYKKDSSGQDTSVPLSTKFDANKTTDIPIKGLEGHFVVCGIRTYSEQGILGGLSGSEPIYIWDLPISKNQYLLYENISLINPHQLMEEHNIPEVERVSTKSFEVNSIKPWNNGEVNGGQVVSDMNQNVKKALYMPDGAEKTGKIKGKNGKEFDTWARYLDFNKDSGYQVELSEYPKQSTLFVSFGRGIPIDPTVGETPQQQQENLSGNVLCAIFDIETEGTPSTGGGSTTVNAKTFLMIGMNQATVFRPKQTISKFGNNYEVAEKLETTNLFSSFDKDILKYGEKGAIVALSNNNGSLNVMLNGKSILSTQMPGSKINFDKTKIYLGDIRSVSEMKNCIDPQELGKTDLNPYQSAKMHFYEVSAIDSVKTEDIEAVYKDMIARYGTKPLP